MNTKARSLLLGILCVLAGCPTYGPFYKEISFSLTIEEQSEGKLVIDLPQAQQAGDPWGTMMREARDVCQERVGRIEILSGSLAAEPPAVLGGLLQRLTVTLGFTAPGSEVLVPWTIGYFQIGPSGPASLQVTDAESGFHIYPDSSLTLHLEGTWASSFVSPLPAVLVLALDVKIRCNQPA